MPTPPVHTVDYHPEGTPDLPEEHSATQHVSLATYLVVFALLMILLGVTVVAAFVINLGDYNISVVPAQHTFTVGQARQVVSDPRRAQIGVEYTF